MRKLPLILLALFSFAAERARAQPAPPTLPAKIHDALIRASADLTPLTITWTERFRPADPAAATIAQLHLDNPADNDLFAPRQLLLSWQDGCFFCRREQSGAQTNDYSFDGRIIYCGLPDALLSPGVPQPHLSLMLASRLASEQPRELWLIDDYFDAAGIWLPCSSAQLAARSPAEPAVLRLIQLPGAKVLSVQSLVDAGRAITRIAIQAEDPQWRAAQDIDLIAFQRDLEMTRNSDQSKAREIDGIKKRRQLPHTRIYTFDLDPALHWAVVRREESYPDGALLMRSTPRDFTALFRPNISLPRAVTVEFFTWPSAAGEFFQQPVITEEITIASLDSKPIAPALFVLNYTTPGAMIVDQSAPGAPRLTEAPATPADLDRAVQKARDLAIAPTPPPPGSNRLWITAGLLVPLAIILAAAIAWRRLNHAKK